jgi:hypothetical protein
MSIIPLRPLDGEVMWNMIVPFAAFERRRRRWFASLICVLLLAGCATTKVDWAGRVGHYTYDQAVLELGPPDKQARLEDGTIVADWLTYRGYSYAYPGFRFGDYPYWYPGPGLPASGGAPNYYVRLTFGPDGKLRAWKKFAR